MGSTSRQIFIQKFFPFRILFFKLKIFEHLGNGASQILQLFLPFACFPKFYLECGPPIWTLTLVSLIKLEKIITERCWKFNFNVKISFILLNNVGSFGGICGMEAGTGSWFCHPSRCKMCVTSDDPALVVPCGGTS